MPYLNDENHRVRSISKFEFRILKLKKKIIGLLLGEVMSDGDYRGRAPSHGLELHNKKKFFGSLNQEKSGKWWPKVG